MEETPREQLERLMGSTGLAYAVRVDSNGRFEPKDGNFKSVILEEKAVEIAWEFAVRSCGSLQMELDAARKEIERLRNQS